MKDYIHSLIEALDSGDGDGRLTMTGEDGTVELAIDVDATALAIWYYEYLDEQSSNPGDV